MTDVAVASIAAVVAQIERLTAHLASGLERASSHRELLAQLSPDEVPLQDAIMEKACRDAGIARVLAQLGEASRDDLLPPEVQKASLALRRECEAAATKMSNAPGGSVMSLCRKAQL